MNKQELYEKGKDFYYDNRYEDNFLDLYDKMDILLDNLDDLRLEIKILIEEKNEEEMTPEDKLQEYYQKLSLVSKDMEAYDTSEVDEITKKMEKFKAKNKYKFIQLENMEKKYALAVEKGDSRKALAPLKDNLKKMKLDTLNLQKQMDRFRAEILEAKGDFVKLEAKQTNILKEISRLQQDIHTKHRKKDNVKLIEIIKRKKSKLDAIKKEIKITFFKIGQTAFNKKLK